LAKNLEHHRIVFKGTKNGLTVKIHPDLEYEDVKDKLFDKLKLYDRFLSGADVLLDWGGKELAVERMDELQQLLSAAGLNLKGTVKSSPSSLHLQEENLMKDIQSEGAGPDQNSKSAVSPERRTPAKAGDPPRSLKVVSEPEPDKPREPNGHPEVSEHTILIQRTIRSGQTIHYPGNIVVLGDVNPGAEIVAGGNIIVMGNLRGIAHAGATGDENAVVTAFRLQPSQLRIADHFTRAPDNESGSPDQPEVARVRDGTVIIEKYQPVERQPKK